MIILQVPLTFNTPRTVVQELGRTGLLPFSSVVASNRPFNSPLVALFIVHCVSCVFLFALPPGDAFLFLLSCKSGVFCLEIILRLSLGCTPVSSYSLALVNTLVSFGLLLLYMPSYRIWNWNPPFRAPKVIIYMFFLSNLFLVAVPFLPPAPGTKTYEKLPYWVCYSYFYFM